MRLITMQHFRFIDKLMKKKKNCIIVFYLLLISKIRSLTNTMELISMSTLTMPPGRK